MPSERPSRFSPFYANARLSIYYKLIIPNFLILALTVSAFLFMVFTGRQERVELQNTTANLRNVSFLLGHLSYQQTEKRRYLLSYGFRQSQDYLKAISKSEAQTERGVEALRLAVNTPKDRELVATFLENRRGITLMEQNLIAAIEGRSKEKTQAAFYRWTLKNEKIEATLADLNVYNLKQLEIASARIDRERGRFRAVMMALIFLVLLLVVGSAVYLHRTIIHPVQLMTQVARRISEGSSEARVHVVPGHQDEISHLGTALNRMASNLIAANSQLEHHVVELSRSNAELEQFAYVASHDLKEPLRMVSSYVQLLQRRYEGKLDQEANEFIRYAVEGARRMHELIGALLEFSRVGRENTPFVPVDCNQVIDVVLGNLAAAIKEAQADVASDRLPTVMGDRQQFIQLFQNLIGNAIKFRNSGKPQVRIGARAQGQQWFFSVADDGIGIDPQFTERIFIIFQRLHRKEEYPGTGIGLAICKKIVERHGGKIWMQPNPDRGVTFHFTVPARPLPETQKG